MQSSEAVTILWFLRRPAEERGDGGRHPRPPEAGRPGRFEGAHGADVSSERRARARGGRRAQEEAGGLEGAHALGEGGEEEVVLLRAESGKSC